MIRPVGFRRVVFDYDRDIPRLQRFLARMRAEVAPSAYFHLGDLLWRIHLPANGFVAERDLPIWVDADGDIAGFGFYLVADRNPEYFLRPELQDSELPEQMVAWSLRTAHDFGHTEIETGCAERDTGKQAMLGVQGFTRIGDPMVFMARSLAEPIGRVLPPVAYTIRPVAISAPDLSATGQHPFDRDRYLAMSHSQGYREDLDIKAYHEGAVVAGCICWYDREDGSGELEPVGTQPEHRRKGLAAGCIALALQNLRSHGAAVAYVRTDESNLPAISLYRKLGFRVIDRDIGWRRTVTNGTGPARATP